MRNYISLTGSPTKYETHHFNFKYHATVGEINIISTSHLTHRNYSHDYFRQSLNFTQFKRESKDNV